MTRAALPDFALVLVFGEPGKLPSQVLQDAICHPDAVATRLQARQLCAVDASDLSKTELINLGRIAADA